MRLLRFFLALRHAGIPVSTGELISLLDGLQRGVGLPTVADLRELARCILIKDEDHHALFERVFAQYFDAAGDAGDADTWTPELAAVLAGLERSPPHQRPEAVVTSLLASIQSVGGGKRRSTPMRYRNYDDDLPLDSRGMRLALRRLRRLTRDGAAVEFDLPETIRATAHNAGMLDIRLRPVRRNAARLLLLMDVGGSMDEHIRRVEELFSAVRAEFSGVEYFYFHNCIYGEVWRDNQRRPSDLLATADLIRRYGERYRLLCVGDATMSPSELLLPGGSTERRNEDTGLRWLERLINAFPRHAWLNPEPEASWPGRQTVRLIQQILRGGMHPLTVRGIHDAMRSLVP